MLRHQNEIQRLPMNPGFYKLGTWVAAHPRAVVGLWVVAIVIGALGAYKLPQVAVGGTGGVDGSPSRAADETLRTDFQNPFIDPLVVAVSAPRLQLEAAPYLTWVKHAAKGLAALPQVRKVSSYADTQEARMRSADGHVTLLLVGLASPDTAAQQRAVAAVREALVPLRAELNALDSAAQIAVTGGPAADFDVNAWSATGGRDAELYALPLTLVILMVAFGTLVAAGLPFLMGLATTTVALGFAFLLAEMVPVSNLLSNVVTMVGLAIGIDYSLLMVTHFREHAPQETVEETVAGTVAQAGTTIAWSGVTVMVGFLGLLFSPILETRCAGIGGAMVVCISVLAALTLLPAGLMLLHPYIDRWPVVPQRLRRANTTLLWHRLGEWIVAHPWPTLIASAGSMLALASPLLQANSGVTNERWFLPRATESRVGAELLSAVRSDNASIPIYAILTTTDASPLLAAAHVGALLDYAGRLQSDPRVTAVASPFSLRKGLGVAEYSMLYQDPDQALRDYPAIAELFMSRDRRAALFEITPANGLAVKEIERLTRDIEKILPVGPFRLVIGGTPAEHNDFNAYMFKSLPRIFAFVIGVTLVFLFIAFRSFLLPIKAVITNLLAVAAGIGAVVAVFQFGWLNGLVGLERPFTAIPLEVPMMVFCLSFGLSMDYELFLLFRIKREYDRDQNNNRATVEGLAAVAPVITGAGLIMAVVFGAFVGADLPVLKMMGVGLCVSVLVDATVIRAFVVPAVMTLAGRWNWYPGRR
jgi:RND superfamily putative drug exporter